MGADLVTLLAEAEGFVRHRLVDARRARVSCRAARRSTWSTQDVSATSRWRTNMVITRATCTTATARPTRARSRTPTAFGVARGRARGSGPSWRTRARAWRVWRASPARQLAYRGQSMGVAYETDPENAADNARSMNNTADTVATFRTLEPGLQQAPPTRRAFRMDECAADRGAELVRRGRQRGGIQGRAVVDRHRFRAGGHAGSPFDTATWIRMRAMRRGITTGRGLSTAGVTPGT